MKNGHSCRQEKWKELQASAPWGTMEDRWYHTTLESIGSWTASYHVPPRLSVWQLWILGDNDLWPHVVRQPTLLSLHPYKTSILQLCRILPWKYLNIQCLNPCVWVDRLCLIWWWSGSLSPVEELVFLVGYCKGAAGMEIQRCFKAVCPSLFECLGNLQREVLVLWCQLQRDSLPELHHYAVIRTASVFVSSEVEALTAH